MTSGTCCGTPRTKSIAGCATSTPAMGSSTWPMRSSSCLTSLPKGRYGMMIQPTQHEAQSTFRIRRPPITASGYTAEVDYTVKRHLDELNGLLGKAIFPREETSPFDDITAATEIAPDAAPEAKSRRRSGGKNKAAPTISELLTLPLKPKRTSGNPWAQGSLLDVLNDL